MYLIKTVKGDITKITDVQEIVNAANNSQMFALCAINLVLFVDYDGEYSEMIKHIKIDDAFNYSLYKQLNTSLKYKEYELRSTYTGYITNIGSFERQYPYRETDFYNFDKFLFTTWRR